MLSAMRSILLAGLLAAAMAAPAEAQPSDPVLAEQVASALVQRAQELFDARVYADAKQLAVEALATSPTGPAAQQARFLIGAIDKALAAQAQPLDDQVDKTPITDPIERPPEQPDAGRPNKWSARTHSALYAGLIGATVGSFFDEESPASGAVPLGIAAGLGAGLYMPRLLDRLDWSEAQLRTMGAGSVWGGVMGGLVADLGDVGGTTARHVLVGSSIGATLGGVAGAALARKDRYTTGDIALVDTLAGIGTAGGFTVGMLMQPAESEAYTLNAILGGSAGVLIGLVAAPQTNTTPRRVLRVAGLSAAGGAVPFLLYAAIADGDSKGDERLVGALSSIGLVGGAYLGFRLTRNLDVGRDVRPGAKPAADDAPTALLRRSSDGRWGAGVIAVQPLSPVLAPQRGLAVPLLGATW